MEETPTKTYKQEIINIQELGGEQLKVNVQQLLRKAKTGTFESTAINAPEGMTFQHDRYLKVVDGFTPNALKNIITVSREKLRVYEVTQNTISLLSCSELRKDIGERVFEKNYQKFKNLIFLKHIQTLQFIEAQGRETIIIKLEAVKGKILTIKRLRFSRNLNSGLIEQSSGLPVPNNSKIDSFLQMSSPDLSRGSSFSTIIFFRNRGEKTRKWLDLTSMTSRASTKIKHKFEGLKKSKLPEQYRELFHFHRLIHLDTFKSGQPGVSIICCRNKLAVSLRIVNLKRKVLRTTSVNLLDLFTLENIKEVIRIGNNQQVQEGGDENQGEEDQEEQDLRGLRIQICSIFFDSKTNSLILDIKLNRRAEIFVKINNPFNSENLSQNSRISFKTKESSGSLLGRFSEDHLFCYSHLKPRSTFKEPLALLNIKDFTITKFKGFEENKAFSAMSGETRYSSVIRVVLPNHRILIITHLSAFIYDYGEGTLISEYRHTLMETDGLPMKKIGDIFTLSSFNRSHLIKTVVGESGVREFKTVKTIFFNDLVPNLKKNYGAPSQLIKLKKGKFLLLAVVYFEDHKKLFGIPCAENLSVELDTKSLEVVKMTRKDISGSVGPLLRGSSIHHVEDLLIFQGRNNPNIQRETHTFLTLSSLDFEILDQCRQAHLQRDFAIGMISGSRIISK